MIWLFNTDPQNIFQLYNPAHHVPETRDPGPGTHQVFGGFSGEFVVTKVFKIFNLSLKFYVIIIIIKIHFYNPPSRSVRPSLRRYTDVQRASIVMTSVHTPMSFIHCYIVPPCGRRRFNVQFERARHTRPIPTVMFDRLKMNLRVCRGFFYPSTWDWVLIIIIIIMPVWVDYKSRL